MSQNNNNNLVKNAYVMIINVSQTEGYDTINLKIN